MQTDYAEEITSALSSKSYSIEFETGLNQTTSTNC